MCLKILVIEDNPWDRELIEYNFQKANVIKAKLDFVGNLNAALHNIEKNPYDVILLDMHLPDSQGIASLKRIYAINRDLPVVILTGSDDTQSAVATLTEGAQDYLIKAKYNHESLMRSILYAIDKKKAEIELSFLAYHDLLTGVSNRKYFTDKLAEIINRSHRHESCFAVFMLDLDFFKQVNDTLGHEAGDRLLQEIAKRIKACLRREDIVGRLGGDEFAVLLSEVDGKAFVAEVARRIIEKIERPVSLNKQPVKVSASIGIALYPDSGEKPETLLRNADLALYESKREKRGQFKFFDLDTNASVSGRLEFRDEIRRLYENQGLTLLYQPVLDLKTGAVVELEALLRNNDGFTAEDIMGAIENSGLMLGIGRWALKEACREMMDNRSSSVPISVNISTNQLNDDKLVASVAGILAEFELDRRRLRLEIKEESLIQHMDEKLTKLLQLHEMGIAIILDGFGENYSMLSLLRKFPFSSVKLSKLLVTDLLSNNPALLETMIRLIHQLGLNIGAIGVETKQQLQQLVKMNCDYAQGFLFSEATLLNDTTAVHRSVELFEA